MLVGEVCRFYVIIEIIERSQRLMRAKIMKNKKGQPFVSVADLKEFFIKELDDFTVRNMTADAYLNTVIRIMESVEKRCGVKVVKPELTMEPVISIIPEGKNSFADDLEKQLDRLFG
jgi:Mg-chelatase subunit ChlI